MWCWMGVGKGCELKQLGVQVLSIAEVQYFLLEGPCWGGGLCVVSQGLGCAEEFLECVKLCGEYHGIAFSLRVHDAGHKGGSIGGDAPF